MPAGGWWRRALVPARTQGALVRGLDVVGARLFQRVMALRHLSGDRVRRRLRPAVLRQSSYVRGRACSRGRAPTGEAVLLRDCRKGLRRAGFLEAREVAPGGGGLGLGPI